MRPGPTLQVRTPRGAAVRAGTEEEGSSVSTVVPGPVPATRTILGP